MCKINCSGGCPECAPEDHIAEFRRLLAELNKIKDDLVKEGIVGHYYVGPNMVYIACLPDKVIFKKTIVKTY